MGIYSENTDNNMNIDTNIDWEGIAINTPMNIAVSDTTSPASFSTSPLLDFRLNLEATIPSNAFNPIRISSIKGKSAQSAGCWDKKGDMSANDIDNAIAAPVIVFGVTLRLPRKRAIGDNSC